MDYITVKKYNEGMEGPERIPVDAALRAAMDKKREAKALKDRAQALDDEANEIIGDFHIMSGARDFTMDGVGKCTVYLGVNRRTDPKVMAEGLVRRGVASDVVADCFEEATTEKPNSKPTVRFTPAA
jgi:hypothetical protein